MRVTRFFISSLLFITFLISQADSGVVFDCFTGEYSIVICKVLGISSEYSLKRIQAEDPEKTCDEGKHYRYEYHTEYEENQGWIYVNHGCGGKFQLVKDARPTWRSWGAWGACSVSCGVAGTMKRTRTCSTGEISDCSTNDNVGDTETEACYRGPCDKANENVESFCGREDPSSSYRIIGGHRSENCKYPWMVMLYNRRIHNFCGASIIDKNRLLTAAHCVKQNSLVSDFVVFSGASLMPFKRSYRNIEGLKLRHVSKVQVHEDFDSKYLSNDVAILTLTEPIKYDECHLPVCLPRASPSKLTGCRVMGWGKTSNGPNARISPNLLITELDIHDPDVCGRIYAGKSFSERRNICAGGNGHGSCKGDSGGPLVCPGEDGRYYQYGLVSGGASDLCGQTPGIYTKVSAFRSWILQKGEVMPPTTTTPPPTTNNFLKWFNQFIQG